MYSCRQFDNLNRLRLRIDEHFGEICAARELALIRITYFVLLYFLVCVCVFLYLVFFYLCLHFVRINVFIICPMLCYSKGTDKKQTCY